MSEKLGAMVSSFLLTNNRVTRVIVEASSNSPVTVANCSN